MRRLAWQAHAYREEPGSGKSRNRTQEVHATEDEHIAVELRHAVVCVGSGVHHLQPPKVKNRTGTERKGSTQTERQTHTQTETERQRDRETDRQTDTHTHMSKTVCMIVCACVLLSERVFHRFEHVPSQRRVEQPLEHQRQ